MTRDTQKLVDAAKFAVENSGDHGCEWCRGNSLGCKQCDAYFQLVEALKPFNEPKEPHPQG